MASSKRPLPPLNSDDEGEIADNVSVEQPPEGEVADDVSVEQPPEGEVADNVSVEQPPEGKVADNVSVEQSLEEVFKLLIRGDHGDGNITLDVKASDTIAAILEQVTALRGPFPSQPWLGCLGRRSPLEEGRTLSDYNIVSGAAVGMYYEWGGR